MCCNLVLIDDVAAVKEERMGTSRETKEENLCFYRARDVKSWLEVGSVEV